MTQPAGNRFTSSYSGTEEATSPEYTTTDNVTATIEISPMNTIDAAGGANIKVEENTLKGS